MIWLIISLTSDQIGEYFLTDTKQIRINFMINNLVLETHGADSVTADQDLFGRFYKFFK